LRGDTDHVGVPLSVEVRDETTAGDTTNELFLRLESERLSVRDLIRARVYQEVREYNADARGLFRGLVQPTDAERERGGYRLKRHKQIEWERQSEEACQAFERGNVLLLVDDRQVESLDEEVVLRPSSSVVFLRLVPLVGG